MLASEKLRLKGAHVLRPQVADREIAEGGQDVALEVAVVIPRQGLADLRRLRGDPARVVAGDPEDVRRRQLVGPPRAWCRRAGERAVEIPCAFAVGGDEHAGRAAALSGLRRRGTLPHERRGIGLEDGAGSRDAHVTGALYGLGAAALFGVSVPLAKILVPTTGTVMLAALLYLGAGLGMTVLSVVLRDVRGGRETGLTRADIPLLLGIVLSGAVVGPVLLLLGLHQLSAVAASLLLTLRPRSRSCSRCGSSGITLVESRSSPSASSCLEPRP